MNLSEYIYALDEELKFLPAKERRKMVGVYQTRINNYLDEGMSEEKIIKSLPDYKEIAKDIYEAKGINYIERREKIIKSKKIADAFLSTVLLLIITIAFFTIGYFSIRHVVLLMPLIEAFSTLNLLDAILMITASVVYIVILAMLLCFLFDLCWLLDGFMLAKIMKACNKDFYQTKCSTFFITSFVDKVTKKKNILFKGVFVTIVIFIVILTSSYITKGYMYSAFKNTIADERVRYELGDATSISFKYNEASIKLEKSSDDKLWLSVKTVFDHHSKIKEEAGNITVLMDKKHQADFFGIMKEATPIITIYVPEGKTVSLDLDIDKGNFELKEIVLENIILNSIDADIYLDSVATNNIEISSEQLDFNIKSSVVSNSAKIKALRGLMLFENNKFNKLYVDNEQAKIGFENTEIITSSVIDNDYGTIQIVNPIGGSWEYTGVGGRLDVNNAVKVDSPFKVKAFNITAENSSNIAINNGEIEEQMILCLDKGNLAFTYLTADIKVEKSCGKLDLVNIIGSIEAVATSGELSIYSTLASNTKDMPNKEISKYFNGLRSLNVSTSNTNVYIGQLDVENISYTINKGVAVLNEVYGKNINLYLIKGKTQYANTVLSNKLHKVENLVIEKDKGTIETDMVISPNEIIYKEVKSE